MDTLINERKRYVKNVILGQQVDNFHDQHLRYFEYTIIELIGVFKNSFSYKRAYVCAQKSPYICVTNKHVVYAVAEIRRIRGTELYRQPKTPSCTMELKSNFILNQAWPQCSR